MQKIPEILEKILFCILSGILFVLFLINLPLFQEPHGFLIMNELSDFSSNQLTTAVLFGSIIVCLGLGVLMMKWFPPFTAGMASNLWATTYFLIWVDSMFTLSVQTQSFHFLILLAFGLLFIYVFFFTLNYLGFPYGSEPGQKGASLNWGLMDYWILGWMGFYFLVSIRLFFNSFSYPELQRPLAMGFCALCFLNYLLFLFIEKHRGRNLQQYSRIGRIVFSLWFLTLLAAEIGQKWIH